MRWSTHVTLGAGFAGTAVIAAVSSGFVQPDPVTIGAVLLGATIGSLLPDLDARESKIKYLKVGKYRPFRQISDFLNVQFGHRGLLHSFAGLAVFGSLCGLMAVVFGPWFPLGLVIGYAVHLMGDAVTITGVPILFPNRKRYGLISRKMRMVTGSVTEEGLFALTGTIVLFALLWVATYIYGFGGIPR